MFCALVQQLWGREGGLPISPRGSGLSLSSQPKTLPASIHQVETAGTPQALGQPAHSLPWTLD